MFKKLFLFVGVLLASITLVSCGKVYHVEIGKNELFWGSGLIRAIEKIEDLPKEYKEANLGSDNVDLDSLPIFEINALKEGDSQTYKVKLFLDRRKRKSSDKYITLAIKIIGEN